MSSDELERLVTEQLAFVREQKAKTNALISAAVAVPESEVRPSRSVPSRSNRSVTEDLRQAVFHSALGVNRQTHQYFEHSYVHGCSASALFVSTADSDIRNPRLDAMYTLSWDTAQSNETALRIAMGVCARLDVL